MFLFFEKSAKKLAAKQKNNTFLLRVKKHPKMKKKCNFEN